MRTKCFWISAIAALFAIAAPLTAQEEKFSKLVGKVTVGDVKKSDTLDVPYLTWGGDVATFWANGGLTTKDGSIFNKLGLKVNLIKGDDFVGQVKNYVEGKTPFLRGTFSQLGIAAEVLNLDPKIKPVVFVQMTWSAGDHMVSRPTVKTLNDLKGKKIALQTGGPHVGMLDDILRTANLTWKDVKIVWAKEITGKGSAADLFSKDATIDACFAISPDMVGLTGGLDKTGTGAEGTVKGAVVLVSTATMKRSIADVYACRKDYYDANKPTIEKFAAGFIKGCEEILELKAKKDPKYKNVLKMAVDIYGKEALPSEADADGLISDALFVGIPGNNAFFKEKGNRSGFDAKLDAAALGFAESRPDFVPSDLDFDKLPSLVGGITGKANSGIAKDFELDKLIYTFKISFDVDQSEFSEDTYGKDFKKAIETASLFGNAVVTIRGHTDPNKLVREFLKAGVEKGYLRREGTGNASEFYTKDGKKLDFTNAKVMKTIVEMVNKDDFSGATVDPKTTLKLADKLSLDRADSVQSAVLKFAAGQKFTLDKKQIKPVGLGVTEPVVALPRTPEDAAKNRIVEFSIYSIKTKGPSAEDGVIFDF